MLKSFTFMDGLQLLLIWAKLTGYLDLPWYLILIPAIGWIVDGTIKEIRKAIKEVG